jgi:cobalt-zinc-cadmium efflux system outer membrane protein
MVDAIIWKSRRWAALALGAAAIAAHGQQPAGPQEVTWPQVLESAWKRARETAESQGQLLRAEAERSSAQSWSAGPPALELEQRTGRGPLRESLRESEVGVSWPVWMPRERPARLGSAEAAIAAAQRSLDAAKWRVGVEVRQAGLDIAAQQAEARQAELQVRLVRGLAEDIDRRVQAGDLARADAMAARAELLQAQVLQQDAVQRLRQARDRWQILTGLQAVPSLHAPATIETAPGGHPELAAAIANVERSRRRLEAVELSRRDPPEVGVRLRRETEPAGSANSVGVTLRIPLATATRNLPLLAEARAELDLATAEEARVRERLAVQAAAARLQVQAATQQLADERSRAALLRERADLIDKSFRAGETALPELLRALGGAAQAETAIVRQQSALDLARARLSQSLGVLP